MKKFFKCSILFLTLLLLFSFKIVKAEGSMQLSPSDIVDEVVRLAKESEGRKEKAHSCLTYVGNIWKSAASPYKQDILKYPSSLLYRLYVSDYASPCARCSYNRFKLPNSNTRSKYNIPNGASVFLKGGSYNCGGHIAGHVGIYIKELDKIAHTWGGKVRIDSLDFFERNGYTYVDWYYHRGMTLEELEPTIENSKLKIDLIDFPSQITVGNSCKIKGTVSSNFKLNTIRGEIYKGKELIYSINTIPKNPYDNFDISSSVINSYIKFGNLSLGSNYTFHIEAFDETDKVVKIDKPFSIVAPEPSTLKINLTSYPTKLSPGTSYGLKGTITSNYKIRKVEGSVHKLINGEYKPMSISSIDTPNSKYLNIASSNLNNDLKFGKLKSPGRFRITITATDDSGKKVTINRYFDIVKVNINLTSIPSTIIAGNGFGLRGSITSGTNYNLKKVSGSITTTNGTVKFSSVDYPNSKTMNIQYANLNKKLSFGKLKPGSYLLKIKAQDTYGNTEEVTYKFVVKTK